MSLLDQPQTQSHNGSSAAEASGDDAGGSWLSQATSAVVNVGSSERAVSIAAGAILAAIGLSRRSLPGVLVAGVGGALVYRGVTGHCHLYQALQLDTAHAEDADVEALASRGIHIEQAFLINRPPQDLYGAWRDFEKLPQIMSHLESVKVLDERRSHWVAKAPAVAGGNVEWDAEITADEPNTRIAWRSLAGSTIDIVGEVRFTPAPADRGTEVHVSLQYLPPGGRLGHLAAKMFGKAPEQQIREDLRKFKRLMETGDVPTTEGQSRGTCAGRGMFARS